MLSSLFVPLCVRPKPASSSSFLLWTSSTETQTVWMSYVISQIAAAPTHDVWSQQAQRLWLISDVAILSCSSVLCCWSSLNDLVLSNAGLVFYFSLERTELCMFVVFIMVDFFFLLDDSKSASSMKIELCHEMLDCSRKEEQTNDNSLNLRGYRVQDRKSLLNKK